MNHSIFHKITPFSMPRAASLAAKYAACNKLGCTPGHPTCMSLTELVDMNLSTFYNMGQGGLSPRVYDFDFYG
jgi:hypothetical protein